MPSISTSLSGEQVVAGNISDHQQCYDIKYYPQEGKLIDKVAVYFILKPKNNISDYNKYAKRSTYFSSLEQLKNFIINLTKAYFYLLERRNIPDIEIARYRMIMLNSFMDELRRKQTDEWQK
jgi:hypothetical protein